MGSYPDHLAVTNKLVADLGGADLKALTAICDAVARLETMLRLPEGQPFLPIDGDRRDAPITALVARWIEDNHHTGGDRGLWTMAALHGVGAVLGAMKMLEEQMRQIAAHVTALEQRQR